MSADVAAHVDGDALWADLMAMAEVGATPAGGSRRLALTDEDAAGRELFLRWTAAAGLVPRTDRAGNLYLRRAGTDPSRAPVLVGSHLDTQPDGGRFDGVLGVLAGLEAVRALDRAGVESAAPIDIVVWSNEEGGRFPRFCTGSAAFAGVTPLDEVRALQAFDGPTYGAELDRLGWSTGEEPGATRPAAYLELHIEQGPELEARGVPVGIVRGIRGIRQLDVRIAGKEGHAGSRMTGRLDAGRAAARVIEALAWVAEEDGAASVTVGRLELDPNAPSVVPGRAHLVADVRPGDLDDPAPLVAAAVRAIEEAVGDLGLTVEIDERRLVYGPIAFDDAVLDPLRSAAARLGEEAVELVSPAGHDAGHVARVCPTGMLFVPCRDGLSHHPDEAIEPAHATAATRVLAEALAELAA
ncbi:hydantoinase/carbamoylase family amidase [Patulibacter americanus]|uniref:hydantoinase/carbamoylase family amidase n=1 Tax=Patulibacter americanus TaxID=588672 RepID=UPI0003B682C8|nr:hydantoinase/carbamoylase family amidase [Patulibacter americanus]